MAGKSAGVLLYRFKDWIIEFFLVHPGGPFWANRDKGAWTIPKGEFGDDENAMEAAVREFHEETGFEISGNFIEMTPIRQKGGKKVYVYSLQGDIDAAKAVSNSFKLEWPPKSGQIKDFPEADRHEWFDYQAAREKINEAQIPALDELIKKINALN